MITRSLLRKQATIQEMKRDFALARSLLKEPRSEIMARIVGDETELGELLKESPLVVLDSLRQMLGFRLPLTRALPALVRDPVVRCGLSDAERGNSPPERWFFVNGIMNDWTLMRISAEHLARAFRRDVHILVNPTDGILIDLLQCFLGRTLDIPCLTARINLQPLQRELAGDSPHERVIILAHSQGAIIASNMLGKCDLVGARPVELYTFGGALDELSAGLDHVEHFANTGDLVARIGVLDPGIRAHRPGTVYTREARGHWFLMHYLQFFKRGEFGTRSRLFNRFSRAADCSAAQRLWSFSAGGRAA